MSQARLIHRYLDGELNDTEENFLFNELSRNPNLRSEFNQQIKIHVVAQNDMNSISPPIESTNALFSTLGFSIPANNYINRINKPETTKPSANVIPKSNFIKKHFSTFLVTLFSSAVTAVILFLLFNSFIKPELNGISSNLKSLNRPIPMSTSYNNDSKNQAVVSAAPQEKDYSAIIRQTIRKELGGYLADLNAIRDLYLASLNSQQDKTLSENKDYYNYNYIYPKEQIIYKNSDNNYSPASNVYYPQNNTVTLRLLNPTNSSFEYVPYYSELSNKGNGDNTHWAFDVRTISSRSNPNIIVGNNNTWYKNLVFSAKYKFDKYNSAGFEVSAEQYSQTFKRKMYGEVYNYTQSPLLLSYGAVYKYSACDLNIIDKIYPYAQVFAGGTVAGALAKTQVGIQYQPADNVTLSVGTEASRLWYNVQGTGYKTDKIGIVYGLSIHY